MHEEFGRDADDITIQSGRDQTRPAINWDRASALDVAPASAVVLSVSASLTELGQASESIDKVVEGLHASPRGNSAQRDFYASCVAKSTPNA